jgi:hypothetical protein
MSVPSKPISFGLNYKQNYEFKYGVQNSALKIMLINKPFINNGVAHKLYNVWGYDRRRDEQ